MTINKAHEGPLDTFCQKLAAAEGGEQRPDKYRQALDELFHAAERDPAIEMVVMLRAGDDVTLLGVQQGQLITNDQHAFRQILRPVVRRLYDYDV